ncbi:putative ATP-dependent RNA helicase DDX20 [Brachyhypopomus gauderio]|uniref:putative ATP-dependent RNA helicase DDX20 n=1 Tax=Brachyhypopomus gauderio TaxID=698409 RepID=UPI004042B17D
MAASVRQAAHKIETRKRTDDVLLSGGVEFSSLLLSKPVLEGLSASGFQRPSPIQLKAIPLGRCGLDLIVQAKSGTGKTCVFTTIALDTLVLENAATQVLVLAPTREIAVQIHAVVMAVGSAMEGLECHVFIGGRPVSQDKIHLKKCHIAIGSPGRIKQLIEMGLLLTSSIRLFVLDEADKLLEEGSFQEQINWIFSSLPVNKQMLALSATYPESLAQHLCRYMREPTFVRLNPTDPGLIGLKQYYKLVSSHALPHKIFEEKVQNLLELFSKIPFNQALVFSNLHTRAQHLADVLASRGLPAVCISGTLSQEQRLEAMSKLKQYQCRVLISTDLTSRGIDAEKVNLVINLDVPQDWETYMHRIGRAGRFGTLGLAVTYCCHGEEENTMMAIAQKCSLALEPLPDPIPAGLMEETCDWDVTVQTPSGSSLALSTGPRANKKKGARSAPAASREPRDAVSTEDQSNCPKDQTECHSPAQPRRDGISRVKREKPDPEGPVALCRASAAPDREPMAALTRRQMQEALPKIPPLSSFKSHTARTASLAEAVADFESFMTTGPGRDVEIIKRYGSHEEVSVMVDEHRKNPSDDGDDCNGAHNGSRACDEMLDMTNGTACPPLGSVGPACRPTTLKCTSASSSSSGSETETEEKTDASASGSTSSIAPRRDESVQVPPGGRRPHNVDPPARATCTSVRSAKPSPSPARAALNTERPRPQALRHRHSTSVLEGLRAGKAAEGGEARPARRKRREDEEEVVEEENSEEEEGEVDHCWRAYYQAWENFYSSLNSAHHYHGAYNWMAAYRMNVVYMMEMMKH